MASSSGFITGPFFRLAETLSHFVHEPIEENHNTAVSLTKARTLLQGQKAIRMAVLAAVGGLIFGPLAVVSFFAMVYFLLTLIIPSLETAQWIFAAVAILLFAGCGYAVYKIASEKFWMTVFKTDTLMSRIEQEANKDAQAVSRTLVDRAVQESHRMGGPEMGPATS